MTLIENFFEEFEIITPKGEAYGTLKGFLHQDCRYFCTKNESINRYDILRRVDDGQIVRIIEEPEKKPGPSKELNFTVAYTQPYRLFAPERSF